MRCDAGNGCETRTIVCRRANDSGEGLRDVHRSSASTVAAGCACQRAQRYVADPKSATTGTRSGEAAEPIAAWSRGWVLARNLYECGNGALDPGEVCDDAKGRRTRLQR